MKSATEMDDSISSKQFFGLKLSYQVFKFKKTWYISLNLIDFSTEKYIFLLKTEFKDKKLSARNQGIQLSS